MRVGVLTFKDLNRAGGTTIRVTGITKFLKELGCDPVLFSPWDLPGELKDKVEFVKVRIEGFVGFASLLYTSSPRTMTPARSFLKGIDLVKKILKKEINILHCHQHPGAGNTSFSIRKYIKVPILFDEHGIISLQKDDFISYLRNKILWPIYLKTEKNLFTLSDGLVVPTEMEKDFVVQRFKMPEDQVYVIPDGVEIDFFSQKIEERERDRVIADNNIQGKKVVLFAGAFKKFGGILDLLEAFKILSNSQNNIALVLIGRGVLFRDVEAYIKKHKLRNVILKGVLPRSELPKYQSIAHVLVEPKIRTEYTEMEPCVKLLECLASGKPTVATNLRYTQKIVKDGENGILVEPSNPISLAMGIRRLLEDHKLSKKIGENGPPSIPKHHFWKTSAEKSIAAYEDILRRCKKRYE